MPKGDEACHVCPPVAGEQVTVASACIDVNGLAITRCMFCLVIERLAAHLVLSWPDLYVKRDDHALVHLSRATRPQRCNGCVSFHFCPVHYQSYVADARGFALHTIIFVALSLMIPRPDNSQASLQVAPSHLAQRALFWPFRYKLRLTLASRPRRVGLERTHIPRRVTEPHRDRRHCAGATSVRRNYDFCKNMPHLFWRVDLRGQRTDEDKHGTRRTRPHLLNAVQNRGYNTQKSK